MHKWTERRRHERVGKEFVLKFQIRSHVLDKKAKNDAPWAEVAALNIGAGGMLFYSNKKLELDALLDLKISFFEEQPPLECVGKVIRVEEVDGSDMYFVALNFAEIEQSTKEAIVRIANGY